MKVYLGPQGNSKDGLLVAQLLKGKDQKGVDYKLRPSQRTESIINHELGVRRLEETWVSTHRHILLELFQA